MVLLFSNLTVEQFLTPVLLSLRVALIALIIVFVLAVLAAHFMARAIFRGKILVETILMLPLVLPPTVVGFLLIIIFGNNSFIGDLYQQLFTDSIMFTWYSAVIASTVVAFPLMYQSAKAGFLNVDEDIENAARVDGANSLQTFLRVTLPLSGTALITGALLSFARAIGEFGATLMIAGNIPGRTQTMPTAIYTALQSGNMALAWAWVITIVVISFLMLMFIRVKANS
ncbi:molybdate ABC transporter permease subunit [Salinicoccus halodurans]|uniref:Molybdenum transport system permease n=1 Tax=Salinicoccus halodurans TaxID=407035 RepID=A0A0F7HH90_9STAP|nr:molybdate ABC transporter permease subunit [Salinicoccus halodurans]AKG72852.1 molybdenum ABC transporter permease [Salinicoccus halodurans]SFK75120.1 molybdate transport system permease protein [Salinicoccus halodurans]